MVLSFLFFGSCTSCEPKVKADKEIKNINPLSHEDSVDFAIKAHKFDSIFTEFYHNRDFNGNVLIAQRGKVIFKKSYGFSNYKTRDRLKSSTRFQIASISKQFTAVAILQLIEKGLISYEDSVQKFFPDFPYPNVTIKLLLCHRSGLPNYIYFCDDIIKDQSKPLYNFQVVDSLIKYSPQRYYPPDTRFNYSNTGYMLLAKIVEEVSGMSFTQYMKENVFEPLEMHNSFIYEKGKVELQNAAIGYSYGPKEAIDNFLNGVTGDKGVYTTTEDLLKWDQGLYTNKIISMNVLQDAFKPWNDKVKTNENYGFGWRLRYLPDSSVVTYHRGWWQGFQSLLIRIPKDTTTIIVLRNRKTRHYIQFQEFLDILYPENNFFKSESDSISEN
ncbi:MAG: hypothetical protein A2W98_02945 [Bacteroidetes bacterium GWF2_33_38]|nr:MAG: hypothetical protein A2W98_02945 [Bacteroidetes bacterium GWF2_33_38]